MRGKFHEVRRGATVELLSRPKMAFRFFTCFWSNFSTNRIQENTDHAQSQDSPCEPTVSLPSQEPVFIDLWNATPHDLLCQKDYILSKDTFSLCTDSPTIPDSLNHSLEQMARGRLSQRPIASELFWLVHFFRLPNDLSLIEHMLESSPPSFQPDLRIQAQAEIHDKDIATKSLEFINSLCNEFDTDLYDIDEKSLILMDRFMQVTFQMDFARIRSFAQEAVPNPRLAILWLNDWARGAAVRPSVMSEDTPAWLAVFIPLSNLHRKALSNEKIWHSFFHCQSKQEMKALVDHATLDIQNFQIFRNVLLRKCRKIIGRLQQILPEELPHGKYFVFRLCRYNKQNLLDHTDVQVLFTDAHVFCPALIFSSVYEISIAQAIKCLLLN